MPGSGCEPGPQAARGVAGVEVQETKRAMMRDVGERLKGRVQFEADVLPYAEWERLSAGAGKLVPTVGIVDSQRAVKDVDEVGKLRRAAKIADRGLEAAPQALELKGFEGPQPAWRLRPTAIP